MPSIAELNRMPADAFVERLGGVYEHAPWAAAAAAAERPFADRDALVAALRAAVDGMDETRKLQLLRNHPELAVRPARAEALTPASAREQAGAGLDRLAPDTFARFETLNRTYRERFGFPFILCVGEHDVDGILAAFTRRVEAERPAEIAEALDQVHRIARLRLGEIVS